MENTLWLIWLFNSYNALNLKVSPRPHVSVFIWKRNFLSTDTTSAYTYPMKTINENGNFWKRSQEWNFLKTLFSRLRVDENGTFRKTLRSHCQFQSTPRNIRNLFKMAEGRQACAVG